MCGKCGEALSRTQPAVRAMDKLFHSNCFCCMSCHRPLQGMQFYDRDGSPQCEDCYMVSKHKLSEWSELHITRSLVHERDEIIKRKDQKLKPKDNLLTKHFELCLFLNQDTTQYFFHFYLKSDSLDFEGFHVYCLLILTEKMYIPFSCIFYLFCPLEFPGCVFPMWGEDHGSCAEGSWPMFPCSMFPLQHLFLRTRGGAFHH